MRRVRHVRSIAASVVHVVHVVHVLSPVHRRPGSHVPYKSQIELRAASMPDAAFSLSASPKLIPEEWQPPGFDIV